MVELLPVKGYLFTFKTQHTPYNKTRLTLKVISLFQPKKFIDSITMLRRLEGEIDLKRKQLTTLRIDATSLEAVKQLKGKIRNPFW